jgi:hypothetical protein
MSPALSSLAITCYFALFSALSLPGGSVTVINYIFQLLFPIPIKQKKCTNKTCLFLQNFSIKCMLFGRPKREKNKFSEVVQT